MQSEVQQFSTPPPNYKLNKHAVNGFSIKPSPAQLFSYVLITFSISIYFSCTHTLLNNSLLLSFYLTTGTILIISSILATIIDPTDRMVYYYKWSKHDKKVTFSPQYNKIVFCDSCDSYCFARSKHCRACNRCVNNFDHHCMWFNNCVGKRNYNYFMTSIVSTFLYTLVVLAHACLASMHADANAQGVLLRLILSWISASMLAIFGFLVLNLIILHIYLIATEQTTYQFLQRKKKEEQAQNKKQKINISKLTIRKQSQNKPQDVSSQQSIANTNLIAVLPNSNSAITAAYIPNDNLQFKIANQCNDQQIKNSHSQLQGIEVSGTHDIENEERQISQKQYKNLPVFLGRNKSLKIMIGSSEVECPFRRRLVSIS